MRGRLGDFVVYQLNGKTVMRRIGKVSGKKYKEGASFERMRQNRQEFGLAVQLSKQIYGIPRRKSLQLFGPQFSGRLHGAFRKLIQKGRGAPGERSFETDYLESLDGFPLNASKPEHGCLVTSAGYFDRAKASFNFSKYLIEKEKDAERVFIMLVALSDVVFDVDKGYKVQYPEWHGKRKVVLAEDFSDFDGLRLEGELPDGVGLMVVVARL